MKCKECPELDKCSRKYNPKKRRPFYPIAQDREASTQGKVLCKLFYCDATRDRTCCFYCEMKERCSNPCLNGPERCGQVTDVIAGAAKTYIKAKVE